MHTICNCLSTCRGMRCGLLWDVGWWGIVGFAILDFEHIDVVRERVNG